MRNLTKSRFPLFLPALVIALLWFSAEPVQAQTLCDPSVQDCSSVSMDCPPPPEAYPIRQCALDGKSAGDWVWNDSEDYWMQCMAFDGYGEIWVYHEPTGGSLGSCACPRDAGSCGFLPFHVSGGIPQICMDFLYSSGKREVNHSGPLATLTCSTPGTFESTPYLPAHPYWPQNAYCNGSSKLIRLPTPALIGSGACTTLNAVQWVGGNPQICRDTNIDPLITTLEWVNHTGSVLAPPLLADCGMGSSFGYTPEVPSHPYLSCNVYFDGTAWRVLSAPGPYPDSPIDTAKQCFTESEIRYISGVEAACTGASGGWQWMPLPKITIDCPIPPTTASAGHAFDDSAHVQALTDTWDDVWKQPWQNMAEQFVVTMMKQVFIIGQFFDAQTQLETQLLLQELTARAHKRYRPDTGICRLGTNVRGLLNSETLYRTNSFLLNRAMLTRETLSSERSSSEGPYNDYQNRLDQFKTTYCDFEENNGNITAICDLNPAPNKKSPKLPAKRTNKDINFMRTVWDNYTLDIDFTDATLTEDEEDVLSLLSYIVSHTVLPQIPEAHLTQAYAKDDLQDMRSVHAVRGITRNSFAHLVGMRAKGSGASANYMFKFLEDLGVTTPEIKLLLGENPSYFARMEVLTRRIFQDPEFYANLYTTPANVKRMGVALQAIKLMQDRDRYDSSLRREMLISLILEMNLREHQQAVTNDLLGSVTVLFNSPPNVTP